MTGGEAPARLSRHAGGASRLRGRYDLVAVVGLAALGAGVALAQVQPTALRAVLSAPLVLLLPGWALTRAAAPPGRFPGEQMLLVSVGSSLAATVVLGLLLDLLSGGLQLEPWVGTLAGLTVAGVASAWWR
ncbi:MAG: DUF1616 domain-containing protein, partial [Acidimicrobiales bacterium]